MVERKLHITMSRDLFNELEYQGLRVIDNCGRSKKAFGIIYTCEKAINPLWNCQCHYLALHELFLDVWQIKSDRGKESKEYIEGHKLIDSFDDNDFYVKHLKNNECLVYCPNIIVEETEQK